MSFDVSITMQKKKKSNISKEHEVINLSVNYLSLYNFNGPNSNVTQKPGVTKMSEAQASEKISNICFYCALLTSMDIFL